jgi:cell division protein FtsW
VRKVASANRGSADKVLLMSTMALVMLGVVMVYSASMPMAQENYGTGYYYLMRQLIRFGLGAIIMFLAMKLKYVWWRKWSYLMLTLCFGLLISVLVSPLAKASNGAQRWLAWGSFSFQPTEIAKWALVVYLAHVLAKLKDAKEKDGMVYTLPVLMLPGVMCVLVAMQPDLGNCLIMIALMLILAFVAGVRLSYLTGIGIVGLGGTVILAAKFPYVLRRLRSFSNLMHDPKGIGFQLNQSLIALGRGGVGGVGLGASRQKVFYLPEAHTDFILSILGEELGFLGVVALLILFGLLIWRGMNIARDAPDNFGGFLAAGITTMIALQAIVNMGVVTGILPTKGLPLPFISYGGSALVLNMLGVGVLLSISRCRTLPVAESARRGSRG